MSCFSEEKIKSLFYFGILSKVFNFSNSGNLTSSHYPTSIFLPIISLFFIVV